MNFSDLNLIAPILRAADSVGYSSPSPIQEQAIPPVLQGRDLLGCAQTGTGKTAAFAMPILQRLAATPTEGRKRPIRALILTPTRELALQIHESFRAYGKYMKLVSCVIFGGVGQNPQVEQLRRGVDILTATPGRLNDLIQQGHIHLEHVEIFVLDEADRMLDMGFVHDVKRVLTYLPKQKQTLLFSATMPREIEDLANGLLHDPAKVMVTPPATTVEAITQSVYLVDKGNKRRLLAYLLKQPDVERALVFTRTKHGADKVVRELDKDGIPAMAIHGNKSQNARQDALTRFKDGRIGVLVATDIAARGIDVSGLSHVFNYDLPNIPETYVHRIGRTGRAGHDGIAVSFCDIDEKEYLADIEKLIHIHIPEVDHAWPMQNFTKTDKATKAARQAESRGRRPQRPQSPKPAVQKQTNQKSYGKEKKAMAQPTQQSPAQQPAQQSTQANPDKKRRRRGGRRHGGVKTGAAQPSAPHPAQQQTANTPKPQAAAQPAQPTAKVESDDTIRVISRRTNAQKYASFEDFMKSQENE